MSRRALRCVSTFLARVHSRRTLAIAFAGMLAGCSHGSGAGATATDTPSLAPSAGPATATPKAALSPDPTPVPSASPSAPLATKAPLATTMPRAATGSRAVVRPTPIVARTPAPTATPSAPQLYSVSAYPMVAHAGDAVQFDARVSPNVVSVSARVAVYSFALYRTRAGHFGETFRIPGDVPPVFRGNYSLTITATSASGETTSRSLPLLFR